MKRILPWLLLTLLTCCAGAQPFAPNLAVQASDFVGIWEGKLDGARVRLTVTLDTSQPSGGPQHPRGQAMVKFERETQPGEPMSFKNMPAWQEQGYLRLLVGLELRLSATDQNMVQATSPNSTRPSLLRRR